MTLPSCQIQAALHRVLASTLTGSVPQARKQHFPPTHAAFRIIFRIRITSGCREVSTHSAGLLLLHRPSLQE